MTDYSAEQQRSPYEVTDLTGARALVLAPHPDDEVFGCGGVIAAHCKAGDSVRVIIMTDGSRGHPQSYDSLPEERKREALASAELLGVSDMVFWGFPDRQLGVTPESTAQLIGQIQEADPDIIYVPSPLEVHPDHRAAANLVWACAGEISPSVRIAFYEVSQPMVVNTLVNIDAFVEQKQAAAVCFRSQVEQIPYDELIQGLNRYRSYTVTSHCRYAEGFFVVEAGLLRDSEVSEFFRWQQYPMRPAQAVSTPRVSVLIRTRNRHGLLREALESVASQTEPSLEAVVVNDGGDTVDPVVVDFQDRLRVRVIEHEPTRGRAAAANSALQAARGTYVNFLDDDDLLRPEHVKELADVLDARGGQVVHADTEVRFVSPDGTERVTQVFDHGFTLEELKVKNQVPIQAVMFRRDLVGSVGGIDETLEAMEDWDFWIRLYMQAPFHHLQKQTSCVRNFSEYRHNFPKWEKIIHERYTDQEEPQGLLATAIRSADLRLFRLQEQLEERGRALQDLTTRLKDQERHCAELAGQMESFHASLCGRLQSWLSRILPPRLQRAVVVCTRAPSSAPLPLKQEPMKGVEPAGRPSSAPPPVHAGPGPDYWEWFKVFGVPGREQCGAVEEKLAKASVPVRFQLLIELEDESQRPLWEQTYQALRAQYYEHWTVTVFSSDVPGSEDEVPGLDWRRCEEGEMAAQVNEVIRQAEPETFLLWLEPGDVLENHALLFLAGEAAAGPEVLLVYADDDLQMEGGGCLDPAFKPDWNPEFARSCEYLDRPAAWRASTVERLGGYRAGYWECRHWDLLLRALKDLSEASVKHVPVVLAHCVPGRSQKEIAPRAQTLSLLGEQVQNGSGRVEATDVPPYWRIVPALPAKKPRVSILIPTRNGLELLRKCVGSILEKTDYPELEILILDNQTDDPTCLAYMKDLEETTSSVKRLSYDHPFNFSALINFGARQASGEVLVLLNNDTQVLEKGWLTELVALAVQPTSGAVGPLLLHDERTIQHAGIFLGVGHVVAGNGLNHCPADRTYLRERFRHVQNVSAVTGACLAIRKTVFEEVGGMEEVHLPVAFNDVDLCLKVRAKGYRNVWTPFAVLLHEEFATRGVDDSPKKIKRFLGEEMYMRRVWGDALKRDPAYNPNLSTGSVTMSLAYPPRNPPYSEVLER